MARAITSRLAFWITPAAALAWFYHGCRAHRRDRDWGKHCDLQCDLRRAAAAPALSGSRSCRKSLPALFAAERTARAHVRNGFSRLAGTESRLRRALGIREWSLQHHGYRPARAGTRGERYRRLLPHHASSAAGWPDIFAGRRFGR